MRSIELGDADADETTASDEQALHCTALRCTALHCTALRQGLNIGLLGYAGELFPWLPSRGAREPVGPSCTPSTNRHPKVVAIMASLLLLVCRAPRVCGPSGDGSEPSRAKAVDTLWQVIAAAREAFAVLCPCRSSGKSAGWSTSSTSSATQSSPRK